MKKILILIILIAIIIGIVIFTPKIRGTNTIKIGMILPLSGPAAQYGEQLKNGAELAKNELNKIGESVEIFYEDSKADPVAGISAYRRLIDLDKVNYVISAMTRSTIPLLDLVGKDKVPLIMTLVAGDWDKTKTDYALRFYPTARQYVRGDNADKVLNGIKSIGVINVNDSYGMSVLKEIQDFASEKGIKINLIESYPANSQDFRTNLLKIKESNVDLILMVSSSPVELSGIAKQYKELNIKPKLFDTSIGLSNPNVRSTSNNILEGVVTKATRAELANKDESAQLFFKNYETSYNSKPYFAAIFGYESIKLINSVNNLPGSNFVERVSQLKSVETIMGKINVENYREINPPIYNAIIKGGELVEF